MPLPVAAPLLDRPGRDVDLAGHLEASGAAPALLTGSGTVTYADLAGRVRETAARLGTGRLVLLPARNDVATVVVLLASLHARCPVLLTTAGTPTDDLVETYDPDVVVEAAGRLRERRSGSAHALHPDLALLLSTSGSTGSPKLVRLSHDNVWSNAAAIAEYLGVRPDDRATTSLPLGYCYGLSVLTSHLLRGAGVVLTALSVADPRFWELFRRTGATTFAGVPYTFDLLDRAGFDALDLPGLRYVTQAGGRLAPERVRAYAALGRRAGWDLFVMYGQTEATARMAYLPPDLALTRPETVGVPVPGSSLAVEDAGEDGVGELVFRGPGVMMGYATTPADLALPAGPSVLRTGDLGRRADDGLFEVVGRKRPFAKVFGLRVDLGRVESALAKDGLTGCCLEVAGRLCVAVEGGTCPADVRRLVAASTGLPASAVSARCLPALPRRDNGKPDLAAVEALLRDTSSDAPSGTSVPDPAPAPADVLGALRAVYAEVLERDDVGPASTFVGLDGDSLSYVEASLRLEQVLGEVPPGWHTRPLADLAGSPPLRPSRWRVLETSVALRALAILLIVGSHANLFMVMGGAHVLLAVAGHNFARFQLSAPRREQGRRLLRAVARIWLPTSAWVAGCLVLADGYGPANLLLVDGLVGGDRWDLSWRLWFLEVLVLLVLAVGGVLQLGPVDRLRRRAPFGVAAAACGVALLLRFEVVALDLGPDRLHTAHLVAWLFTLGWAGAEARTIVQRSAVTVAACVSVPGFFPQPERGAVVLAGLLALLWLPHVRVPDPLARVAGVLAASSLYVYVTHWQVYPHLEDVFPLGAVAASFAVGLAYWQLCQAVSRRLSTRMRPAASGTPARCRPTIISARRAAATRRPPRATAGAR